MNHSFYISLFCAEVQLTVKPFILGVSWSSGGLTSTRSMLGTGLSTLAWERRWTSGRPENIYFYTPKLVLSPRLWFIITERVHSSSASSSWTWAATTLPWRLVATPFNLSFQGLIKGRQQKQQHVHVVHLVPPDQSSNYGDLVWRTWL